MPLMPVIVMRLLIGDHDGNADEVCRCMMFVVVWWVRVLMMMAHVTKVMMFLVKMLMTVVVGASPLSFRAVGHSSGRVKGNLAILVNRPRGLIPNFLRICTSKPAKPKA